MQPSQKYLAKMRKSTQNYTTNQHSVILHYGEEINCTYNTHKIVKK